MNSNNNVFAQEAEEFKRKRPKDSPENLAPKRGNKILRKSPSDSELNSKNLAAEGKQPSKARKTQTGANFLRPNDQKVVGWVNPNQNKQSFNPPSNSSISNQNINNIPSGQSFHSRGEINLQPVTQPPLTATNNYAPVNQPPVTNNYPLVNQAPATNNYPPVTQSPVVTGTNNYPPLNQPPVTGSNNYLPLSQPAGTGSNNYLIRKKTEFDAIIPDGHPILKMPYQNFTIQQIQQLEFMVTSFKQDHAKNMLKDLLRTLKLNRTQDLWLPVENPLTNKKIRAFANDINIKPQLVEILRSIKTHLSNPLRKVNQEKRRLEKLSFSFSQNVYQKLKIHKERLTYYMAKFKMVDQMKKEISQIESQIKTFFQPLFTAMQTKANFQFDDPSPFCVSVSAKILKKMTQLENQMDQLLTCEAEPSQETDTAEVVMQMIQYYQDVATTLRQYSLKYQELKQLAIKNNALGEGEQKFKQLNEEGTLALNKELRPYEMIKEIQFLLEKRRQRILRQTKV